MTAHKAILEFDLSDPDGARAFELAVQGNNCNVLIQNLDNHLRNQIKHNPQQLPPERLSAYEELRTHLHELCSDLNIKLN